MYKMSSAGIKSVSRYTSFDSHSSTSSSADLKSSSSSSKPKSCRKNSPNPNSSSSRCDAIVKVKTQQNLAAMVKKFMEKRSDSHSKPKPASSKKDLPVPVIVPADFIADDLKKTARKGSSSSSSTLANLPKKLLFGKGSSDKKQQPKALTEVKSNTRTLAMVLRSERELLSINKEQEDKIAQLESSLHHRSLEVEKLKDLCLKQREEIMALKNAILFPDEMNTQLQRLLDTQGSELKQARQVIPSLQTQISSLNAQLHTLSHHLQQVKAVKYTGKSCIDGNFSPPKTPMYNQDEDVNSLDFSSDDDPTTPNSPNDMLLKDMNPCLTPCYSKMKSKYYKTTDFEYSHDEEAYEVSPVARKMSRSSDHLSILKDSRSNARVPFCMSDESKCRYGKRMFL